jgi:hypothetical protein
MKIRSFHLAALALFVVPSLIGCSQELSTNPVSDQSFEPSSQMSDAITASSGKSMFAECEQRAMATLSLSEVVRLTPFITGEKTSETASLSELVALTPTVEKFRTAFNAELASLSLGDVVKVTRYMVQSGKSRYPYPVLDGNVSA